MRPGIVGNYKDENVQSNAEEKKRHGIVIDCSNPFTDRRVKKEP